MIQLKEKDNWEWKPLKYIFNYFLSSVDRKIKDEELNVHICHYPDVYKNEKISDKDTLNKGTCTEFELENFKLMKGDILITKDSEDPKDIGIPCLVENDLIDSVCGYHIGILRTNENIEREFYFRYIQSTDVKDYFFCESNWITRFGLGKSSVENLKIPILSIQEQKIISQYLDKKTKQIDSLIEKIEKKIELLKEQKTALINQCVTKGLNPNVEKKDSGVEWIGKIPSHWQLLRLNNLGRFSKGKGITKDKIKVNGNKCIRCGEIYTTYELRFNRTRSFIDDDTSDESVLATKGVLLFTGDGESLEEIGKCIVYEGEEDLYIGGGINVFTPKQEKVIPIYLSYVMNSESVIYQKSRQGKGEIVVHIYSKQLKEIRLGLPSIKEQQQIVEYLDQKTSLIDKIISYENKRLLFLKEYKKSLISEVVTGKKRVV